MSDDSTSPPGGRRTDPTRPKQRGNAEPKRRRAAPTSGDDQNDPATHDPAANDAEDQPASEPASEVESAPTAVSTVVLPPGPGAGIELELPPNMAILPSRDAVLYPGMLL